MSRTLANSLAAQLLALQAQRSTEPDRTAPLRIDLDHYLNPAQFEQETARLFRRGPLLVAYSAELPTPGSYKTHDYTGVPMLLVRGRDGVVRAFANICRHRGARLVGGETCRGERKSLTCRYHGWNYGLDGQLRGVSDAHLFGAIEPDSHGLIALPCAEKHGMVFACATPGAPIDIDAHLGSALSEELAGWQFETLQFVDSTTIDSRSNWKFQLDTFLESYHVESLHGSTIGPLSLSGYALQQPFGRHQRMTFAAKTLLSLRDQPPEAWQGHKHLSIVYHLFPNIVIVYGALWVQTFQIHPGASVDSQSTEFALFCRKPMLTDEQRAAGRAYFDLNMQFVPTEDYVMGREVTAGARTGLLPYHLFGATERALLHFHRNLRDSLGLEADGLLYRP